MLAHVGLSEALWQIYYRDGDRETLAEAESEAETACRIDPDEPTAQVALARILRTTGGRMPPSSNSRTSWPDTRVPTRPTASSRGAINGSVTSTKPRPPTARPPPSTRATGPHWNSLGTFLMIQGRYEDALTSFERAAELAPPEITRPKQQLATYHLHMGRFDEAIDAFERIPKSKSGSGCGVEPRDCLFLFRPPGQVGTR